VTQGRYARTEIERRFLLAGVPDPAEVVKVVDMDDRYLDETRLRLRRQVQREGPAVFKLTQKVPHPGRHGQQGAITTIYLSEAEHAALATLPGALLHKSRLSIAPYGVDVFGAPLEGLVLAEAEFGSLTDAEAFQPAAFCHAEVSHDHRFTGGALVRATPEQVCSWAAEYGVDLSATPSRRRWLPSPPPGRR
jgi:CYTH domain-containing protein